VIRVLIVDDSAVLRQSTRFILESDSELKVVGEAGNGMEAITLVGRLRPDVITMDIRMPKMDGFEAIRQIMAEHPAPIIVVTSADLDREAHISSQAARLGAVHVMKRPEGTAAAGYKAFAAKLIEQVKLMSTVRVVHRLCPQSRSGAGLSPSAASPALPITPSGPPPLRGGHGQGTLGATLPMARVGVAPVKTDIVAIGSSTGGPAALHKILSELPADFPTPIVIVQHISFGFVEGLASWLDTASPLQVKVGKQGERMQPGNVYIAPDGHHMLVDRFGKISLNEAEMVGGFRPSVTPLFDSVARANGSAAMGVILTGMGTDGAVGMQNLHQAGAITLAQDQASCVVFGMPKEAIALGAIQHIVPLDKVAQKMTELVVV